MAALRSRCGHHILPRGLYLFSSPNISGRRLIVYHTSTHCVASVRIYNACLKCAARGSLEMAALPNIGSALCLTPQSLADAHYWNAVQ